MAYTVNRVELNLPPSAHQNLICTLRRIEGDYLVGWHS